MGSTNRSDPTAEKDSTVSDSGKLIRDENFQATRQETKFYTDPRFGSMFTESSFSSSSASKPTKRKTEPPVRHYSTKYNNVQEEEAKKVQEENVELVQDAAALETIQLSYQSEDSEFASSSDDEEDVQGEAAAEAQVQASIYLFHPVFFT